MAQSATSPTATATNAAQLSTPSLDSPTPSQVLEPLKTYDTGSSRASLVPLDDALLVAIKEPKARPEWEARLTALLHDKISLVAKRFLCAKLALVGSARSVPALAALLAEPEIAHAAQDALTAIPGPESLKALRDSLPRLRGLPRLGVITSLGARHDEASVPLLVPLLEESDSSVAIAAAAALGIIGTVEAAEALRKLLSAAAPASHLAAADACLACAERLLEANQKPTALALYKLLAAPNQPKQVQLAARRGLLLAAKSQ